MLVDRAAIRHDGQPARRVRDVAAREQRRVEALPGHRVARFQVSRIELHPAGPQARAHDREHPLAHSLELPPQQTLGAVAA